MIFEKQISVIFGTEGILGGVGIFLALLGQFWLLPYIGITAATLAAIMLILMGVSVIWGVEE